MHNINKTAFKLIVFGRSAGSKSVDMKHTPDDLTARDKLIAAGAHNRKFNFRLNNLANISRVHQGKEEVLLSLDYRLRFGVILVRFC